MSHASIAVGPNAEVIEELYQRWRKAPESVEPGWQNFFEGFELGQARPAAASADALRRSGIEELIYAYRDIGHFIAHLDPLADPRPTPPLLDLPEFGLRPEDLDRVVDTAPFEGLGNATIGTLIQALRDTYCRSVGVEYMHIQDANIRRWLQARMEPVRNAPPFTAARKARLLESLCTAEQFENYLQVKYDGQKRFSLEGGETLIPLLEVLVDRAPRESVREIVIGMPHRGRLNVLANILRKPYGEIFAQFEEGYLPDTGDGDGDVKYHLGASSDRVVEGRHVHISLTPNPSHLEAVNPVVEGRVRAKQERFGDKERRWGLPVLIHGDAAFAGQGLVAETLNLSQLEGYRTGGTIHIIVNNQIGFTTVPADARSTRYCTDVAKMLECPIFHVNGEDPEAVLFVTELALQFRQVFHSDVVIDMVCYRRYGHNETDEPAFTQPVEYARIRSRPTLAAIYSRKLVDAGVLSEEEAQAIRNNFKGLLEIAREVVKMGPKQYPLMLGWEGSWKGLARHYSHKPIETGATEATLRAVAEGIVRVPDGFTVHPKLAPLFAGWRQAVLEEKPISWGLAETLAFGALVLEGTPVRLSGQDSRRGTFSQRHAAVYDANTGRRFVPLTALDEKQATFEVYDSLLSEAAVLGFEYGYAMDAPAALVMWEAQFGDFVNGAQVIIDQFIASSGSKWARDSGVVLLLPHGHEGQGPEHTSARLERFLQLCAEDNMQVCYPSTPAQYFHLLRRQVRRPFRKPLVVMTPKSLLRSAACVSQVSELVKGHFRDVLDDAGVTPEACRRVLLCSGKVYYDLVAYRREKQIDDVAVVRLEQLYPFPEQQLRDVLKTFPARAECVWVQEESANNGAWTFLDQRLRQMGLGNVPYVGRDASASPATGSYAVHQREQAELVEAAFGDQLPYHVRATSFASISEAAKAAVSGDGQKNGQRGPVAAKATISS